MLKQIFRDLEESISDQVRGVLLAHRRSIPY